MVLVGTAVWAREKLGLQSTTKNWQWWRCPNWLWQTVRFCHTTLKSIKKRVYVRVCETASQLREITYRTVSHNVTYWEKGLICRLGICFLDHCCVHFVSDSVVRVFAEHVIMCRIPLFDVSYQLRWISQLLDAFAAVIGAAYWCLVVAEELCCLSNGGRCWLGCLACKSRPRNDL